MKKIGLIENYLDKIGVAIINLTDNIARGDELLFLRKDFIYRQHAEAMQIENKYIKKAEAGQSIGLKVAVEIPRNAKVFKIEKEDYI